MLDTTTEVSCDKCNVFLQTGVYMHVRMYTFYHQNFTPFIKIWTT